MWKPERAKQIMKREGRTREWLADQCGITVESLSQCLSNVDRRPSRPVLLHMARVLNCDINDLVDEAAQRQAG
jgi:transcriptional regulator with XRE-family HTH domain